MQQVQYARGTAQCYGQCWVKKPEAQEKKKKKGKSMKGLKACFFSAFHKPTAEVVHSSRTALGAVAVVTISPKASSSTGAAPRLRSWPSSQHSTQWVQFGHWLSPQLLWLLSGEHVCSHKEFNKLTTNKVAWKWHRLTRAAPRQEEACQLVVFTNLKGKFPRPIKYMEMFPCLDMLEKNTIIAEGK